MKYLLIILVLLSACSDQKEKTYIEMDQQKSTNEKIRNHTFLENMYQDSYFPAFMVDKVKAVLIELCIEIETQKPQDLEALYALTHASTEKINDLEEEFNENDSEIETVAREYIAEEFEFIATAHGFEADIEELIATRNW